MKNKSVEYLKNELEEVRKNINNLESLKPEYEQDVINANDNLNGLMSEIEENWEVFDAIKAQLRHIGESEE